MTQAELPQQSVPLTVEQALQHAVGFHQAGQLADAERLYRAILETRPRHPDANHNLGVLALQRQQTQASLPHFKLALEEAPEQGQYWLSYAEALQQAGQAGAARQLLELGRQRGLQGEAVEALAKRLGADEEMAALVGLHQQGQYGQAEQLARSLTERFPQSGVAWKILGTSLFKQGKDPRQALQKALELLPGDAEVHRVVGSALQDGGQLEGAAASYRQALSLKPDDDQAYGGLGCVLRDLGRMEEAQSCFERALALNAGNAEAHFNLGVLRWRHGALNAAETCFEQALASNADYAEACHELACLLASRKEPAQAQKYYEQTLTLGLNRLARPGEMRKMRDIRMVLVHSARRVSFGNSPLALRNALLRAISEPWCRPALVAHSCCALIKLEPEVGRLVARAVAAWPQRLSAGELYGETGLATVAADSLLRGLLVSLPVCDGELERFLTLARRILLAAAHGGGERPEAENAALDFYAALARQCFINEYVFALSGDEAGQAAALRDALAQSALAGGAISPAGLLALACYFPLHTLPGIGALLERAWPEPVAAVLRQQVVEPAEEIRARGEIPRLTEIDGEVSVSVRQQYEENPYPRWVRTAYPNIPLSIDGILRQRFPLGDYRPLALSAPAEILIAGCGTGQQPIEAALRYRDAKLLAIDLSLSSICYARRKTRELGIGSIDYAQADIMKLGGLDRRFDVIESSGVLHHLEDPFAGWRVLLSLLRPGGVMLLGFYSEVARRDIIRGRAYIAEQAYESTAEGIRRCRQDLMSSRATVDLGNTLQSPDFFSTSACRDLLFHVQEHHLTLAGIQSFLRENSLVFLGFEIEPGALHAYRRRFPDDPAATRLDQWALFEEENPYLFQGMYQFWVQRAL